MATKSKYVAPTTYATEKDASLPADKMLEVNAAQLQTARAGEALKTMKIRVLDEGPDRTIDNNTSYTRTISVEGFSPQATVLELRQYVADQEQMPLEDVNFFVVTSGIPDNAKLAECYVDWMGYGLDDWPPKFIMKPKVKGFEVFIKVPAIRDTSIWEAGRLTNFCDRLMVFDVEAGTTVKELKDLACKRIKIPADRQTLTATINRGDFRNNPHGDQVELEDDTKTMIDYDLDKFPPVSMILEKKCFDANGRYIFDDAYWDEKGYHPQPEYSWIPTDSLADRSRPDVGAVDPNTPATIITDRRQAEAAAAQADE